MPLDRRRFLHRSSLAVAASTLLTTCGDDATPAAWSETADRVWIGPDYWAQPLQDWRLSGGRVECVFPSFERRLHWLTREIAPGPGAFTMSVRVGALDGTLGDAAGSVGFRIGQKGELDDYRHALVHGRGLDVGLSPTRGLFIGEPDEPGAQQLDLDRESAVLQVEASRDALKLAMLDADTGQELASIERNSLPADALTGGVALLANARPQGSGAPNQQESEDAGAFWFDDWTLTGDRVQQHPDRRFGPILFAHHTLSRGVLKITAQMPPIGASDPQEVRLEAQKDGAWTEVAAAPIDPDARTATLRVENWDAAADTPYRLLYADDTFEGTIRRDPVDKATITIADVSCNAHYAFPNNACVASVEKLDPDLFCFTGDQYYESTGGYGVVRHSTGDRPILDMLRKWYQHGWTWRELLRDRPAVSIPDDHDVFHGNIWGEGGEACEPGETQESGGYMMQPDFVNAVHRTQTAHHPDIPDPAPGKRGISVYFGDMLYGGVSWAILADRQFKTAPDGNAPPTGGRADHVTDADFNPKTADNPDFHLLGDRQMQFLADWVEDWEGAEMKAAISQTIFTAMATHHGGNHMRLIADYDTNGWPQTARNEAVKLLRKAFAFHLAGDQHLPAVVHYGIDQQGDGPVAFAGPAVNNLYPRWFQPEGADSPLGDFTDSFGHPLRVLACGNAELEFRDGILNREADKKAGFGVVRFHKPERTITIECWPLLADPTAAGTQMESWPVEVSQLDNYGAPISGRLDALPDDAGANPAVTVISEDSGELVYALRAPGPNWRPHVYAPGAYTVRAVNQETGQTTERTNLQPSATL